MGDKRKDREVKHSCSLLDASEKIGPEVNTEKTM
jgi:hypothetical protein